MDQHGQTRRASISTTAILLTFCPTISPSRSMSLALHMPPVYGPGDNYHPEHSHVPAALIRRLHEAKLAGAPTITVWGTGRPRREFLAVDDLADACVFVLKHYSGSEVLNVGTGQDITIAEFAQLVADLVGYRGCFVFDTSRPDGAPQKLLNVSELMRLGWRAKTRLREGIAAAYADFLASAASDCSKGLRRSGFDQITNDNQF